MADFVQFDEGSNYIIQNGWPTTVYFLLSTAKVGALTNSSTLAGGLEEITGTGYARQSQARPTPVGGVLSFTQMTWATGVATDWPRNVTSIIAVTSPNNVGTALCAWNLQGGGAPRDMSGSNTYADVTPIYVS